MRNDCSVKKALSICQFETHFRWFFKYLGGGRGGGVGEAEPGFRRRFADVVNQGPVVR